MQLAAFEAFIKVMETGSISLAAEQLFITQPAVSKRIQSLETYLDVKLFESSGRGIQATQAAKNVLPKVKAWLNQLQDIQHQLSYEQQGVQGRLTLGTSHHIGLHHLPAPMRQFVQRYPQVALDVHFVDSEQAHEQVLAGDLELAFLTLPPQLDHRLKYIPLWDDPLLFVAAPFHPLSQANSLNLQDLLHYPSLLPAAQTYTSQITLAEFTRHGLKPKITMSNNPLESIRMLVSIGLGWSVLPETLINQDLKRLAVNSSLQRQLGMVWHPARRLSKAADALILAMQQHVG